ncbi:hypothetical protein MASR2M70_01070 [Bacillota bacterium]
MYQEKASNNKFVAGIGVRAALGFMAFSFNNFERYRKYLRSKDGWNNFSIGLKTENDSVGATIEFRDGKAFTRKGADNTTAQMILENESALMSMATLPPNEINNLILKSKLIIKGNYVYISYFNFLMSVILKNKQIKQLRAQRESMKLPSQMSGGGGKIRHRNKEYLKATERDKGVKYLTDQNLSDYSLKDFPRLEEFLNIHYTQKPSVCIERPALLTDWFRSHGFEFDQDGKARAAELRQAEAFKYLMEHKKPIIRKNDLIAGTSTLKEIGVLMYPDGAGPMLWGEAFTMQDRPLNPYDIEPDESWELNHSIFPYYFNRNLREWVRSTYNNPVYQELDERFAVYFLWKTVAISHTIIDYPKLLRLGARGIIEEIQGELDSDKQASQQKRDTLKAMILCYEGIITYANNLAKQAVEEAREEKDPKRQEELLKIADICNRIPENPCETLDDAVNAIWIHWIAVHMENTNAGFSIGRMDQWLQPYFEADVEKLQSEEEKEACIKHAIEMVGCFFMRCTDHLPTIPDIGNYLFGGSSSDQAITLGGVTPEGEDAVNDMTYIFLKATEILGIRDPNVNARYNSGKNSKAYLERLCEVNVNTAGTPSIHNDEKVMESLEEFNYPPEHLRDWAATGCVEPTISGKHIGHTNCMMFNMVAALEMALYNGYHPLMRWNLGPETGDPEDFKTFDEFFRAFCEQLSFIADLSCEYNNKLGEAHSVLRPTPMMSAMVENCIKSGTDATKGGALYNSSGIAAIGLADITDSMLVIKKLVYDDKSYTLKEVCDAIKCNFIGHEILSSRMMNSVSLFGSNSQEAVDMADKVAKFVHDYFGGKKNFRGGPYTVGFWSMSNHVAFGTLTGALPSGRLAGKPFTPGLTPEAHASRSLLDNIKDVAKLDSANINNNIAFNVKVVPSKRDTHKQVVDNLYAYAKAYCDLGGMQMQFNVVSSETMKKAMKNPDDYRDLLVRISGYNAYFVTLNRDLQMELIERAEYGL